MLRRTIEITLPLLLLGAAAGCAREESELRWETPPLAAADKVLDPKLDHSKIPSLGRADAVYPAKFDLLQYAPPVRHQGNRGTCSFFSAASVIEMVAKKEGRTLDLSEQFLVWLNKIKAPAVRPWTQDEDAIVTEGAVVADNLFAVGEFGAVEESAYPYNPNLWSSFDHADVCTTEATLEPLCIAQGHPPDQVLTAPRIRIDNVRRVARSETEIKNVLHELKQPVALSIAVHCQVWNRRPCPLPLSTERFFSGILTSPNPEDVAGWEADPKKMAHAMAIIGWDDTFEAPLIDKKGNPVKKNGKVVKEKGFYIVRNSWGTDNLGAKSPFSPGYLLFSKEYVHKYGTLDTASMRTRTDYQPELCMGGIDEDSNGKIDCADSRCAGTSTCLPELQTLSFASTTRTAIPDMGMTSASFEMARQPENTVAINVGLSIELDHTSPADLKLTLISPKGTRYDLNDSQLSGTGKITVNRQRQMRELLTAGQWKLEVADTVIKDKGSLLGWKLFVQTCTGPECVGTELVTGSGQTATPLLHTTTFPLNQDSRTSAPRFWSNAEYVEVELSVEHPDPSALLVGVAEQNENISYSGQHLRGSRSKFRFARLFADDPLLTIVDTGIAAGAPSRGRLLSYRVSAKYCKGGCLNTAALATIDTWASDSQEEEDHDHPDFEPLPDPLPENSDYLSKKVEIAVEPGFKISSAILQLQTVHARRQDLQIDIEELGPGDRVVRTIPVAAPGQHREEYDSFWIPEFASVTRGEFRLRIRDTVHGEAGVFRSAMIEYVAAVDLGIAPTPPAPPAPPTPPTPTAPLRTVHAYSTRSPIPDASTAGVRADVVVADGGPIETVALDLDIEHAFEFDLLISLQKISPTGAVLRSVEVYSGDSENPLPRHFETQAFSGLDAAGTWRLVVSDRLPRDVGVLKSFTLTIQRR